MFNPRHLLLMSRMARHRRSPKKVIIVLGIVVLCLALFGLEQLGFLPDWMSADRMPRRTPLR